MDRWCCYQCSLRTSRLFAVPRHLWGPASTPDRVRVWQVDQLQSTRSFPFGRRCYFYSRPKDCDAFHHEVLQIAVSHQLDLVATRIFGRGERDLRLENGGSGAASSSVPPLAAGAAIAERNHDQLELVTLLLSLRGGRPARTLSRF